MMPYQASIWRAVFQASVRDAVALLEAVALQPLRHLQRAGADVAIGGAHDRPFDRARHDLAAAVLARRVIEDLVAKQRPFLHQPKHCDPPRTATGPIVRSPWLLSSDLHATAARRRQTGERLVGHNAATLGWDIERGRDIVGDMAWTPNPRPNWHADCRLDRMRSRRGAVGRASRHA